MTSNDEIYLSYLCDQILVACDRIHKKLDKYDEFLSSYTTPVISYHEQPSWHVAIDVVQPRPPPDPPNGQPELYRHQLNPYTATHPPSWQTPLPPPPATIHHPPMPPYVPPRQTTAATTAQCHNYPQPPLHYLQQRPQSYRQPPLTAAAAASLPHQNYQPDGHQPCTSTPPLGWPPPPPQHSLSDSSPSSHDCSVAPRPAVAPPHTDDFQRLLCNVVASTVQVDDGGRTLLLGKNHEEFNRVPEDQREALPRLPLARLKTGDEPFNWVGKLERAAVPLPTSLPAAIPSSMKKREAGTIVDRVVAQTTAIAEKISDLTNVAWAYESVWATGTDVAAQIKISYGVAVKSVALDDWASINLTRKYGREFMKRSESSMFLKSFGWNKFSVIEFDPGGDTSKLQFLTFFVVSWFPP